MLKALPSLYPDPDAADYDAPEASKRDLQTTFSVSVPQ
jgi:hypothetical protein